MHKQRTCDKLASMERRGRLLSLGGPVAWFSVFLYTLLAVSVSAEEVPLVNLDKPHVPLKPEDWVPVLDIPPFEELTACTLVLDIDEEQEIVDAMADYALQLETEPDACLTLVIIGDIKLTQQIEVTMGMTVAVVGNCLDEDGNSKWCALDGQYLVRHFTVTLASLYVASMVLQYGWSYGANNAPQATLLGDSSPYGGAILALGSDIVLHDSVIEFSSAWRGAGVAIIPHNEDVVFELGTFIFPRMHMQNVIFGGNIAQESDQSQTTEPQESRGGSIFNLRAEVTGTSCQFFYNTAATTGGIHTELGGINSFMDSYFEGNAGLSFKGGAASIITITTSFPIELSEFACFNCGALYGGASFGGGFHVDDGSVFVADGLYCANNTANTYGGCINIFQFSDLIETQVYVNNSIFEFNTAQERGGAINSLSFNPELNLTIAVSNSGFYNNEAELVGGAFSLDNGRTEATFESVEVIGGESINGGGFAIFGVGLKHVVVNQALFSNNIGTSGAAIYMENRGQLDLSEVAFIENNAEDFGGALVMRHIDVTGSGPEGAIANILDCYFLDNTVTLTRGAGIYVTNSATVNVKGTYFVGNLAQEGGGMYIGNTAEGSETIVKIEDTTFEGNMVVGLAQNIGGGVQITILEALDSYIDFECKNCNFTGNVAEFGGGLYARTFADPTISTGFTIALLQSTFQDNAASTSGGGVYVFADAELKIDGTDFSENEADEDGGGLYYRPATPGEVNDFMEIQGSYFAGNRAMLGGGVYASRSSFGSITDSSFTGNLASEAGGGFALGRYGEVPDSEDTVTVEEAPLFVITDSDFVDDDAGIASEIFMNRRQASFVGGNLSSGDLVATPVSELEESDQSCLLEASNALLLADAGVDISSNADIVLMLEGAGSTIKVDNDKFEVDSTPPYCPGDDDECVVFMVEEFQTDIAQLLFEFPVFVDDEGDVTSYDFAVGNSEAATNVRQFGEFSIDAAEFCNTTHCTFSWNATENGLSLTPESVYWVSVKAFNSFGVESEVITAVEGTSIFRYCPLHHWLLIEIDAVDVCIPCPKNMITDRTGVIDINECYCRGENYRLVSDDITQGCEPCPDGGVCEGGDQYPYPQPGFWSEFEEKAQPLFLECETDRCEGGDDVENICTYGYRDTLCSECRSGYSMVAGFCFKCDGDVNLGVIQGFAIPLIMLLWVILNKIAEISVGSDVMLAFISETSLMLNLQVDYPTSLQTIFYITSILAFQIDIVSPGCLFSWTAASSFYLQSAVPVIAAVFYALYFGCLYLYSKWHIRREAKKKKEEEGQEDDGKMAESLPVASIAFSNFRMTLLSFYQLLIVALVETGVAPWRCTSLPSGDAFLSNFPSVECGSGEHVLMRVIGALLITGALVYIVWYAWFLYKAHRANVLGDESFMNKWGFMYDIYRNGFIWWDVKIAVEKAALSTSTVLLEDPFWQILLSAVIMICGTVFHAYAKPFRHDLARFNNIAMYLGVFQSAMFVGAFVYISEVGSSDGIQTFVEVVILVVLSAFLLLSASYALLDLLKWGYYPTRNFFLTIRLLKKHTCWHTDVVWNVPLTWRNISDAGWFCG
mmetsp:Transcript_10688/g.39221  ORF Transcript_10688/g.39221 Transcript_10688/m.39221 type:complete len:1578 (+) Transcript_10688:127-4860(+)